MKKNKLLLLICSLSPLFLFSQCLMKEVSLKNRIDESTIIVEGKVLSKKCFWNKLHTVIYTKNEIEVYKVFKGNISSSKIKVITAGGRIGKELHLVEPELDLAKGQNGILLLKQTFMFDGDLELVPVASAQGFILYDLTIQRASDIFHLYADIKNYLYPAITQLTGAPYKEIMAFDVDDHRHVVTAAAPVITSFAPNTITAGTFDTLSIKGSNFGASNTGSAKVEFKNADDGGTTYIAAPPGNIVSWSADEIKVIIPSAAGTGVVRVTNTGGEAGTSSFTITVLFNQNTLNSSGVYYEPNLVNIGSTGGYRFKYSTSAANSGVSFAGHTNAKARFESALKSWRCATGFNVMVDSTTTTTVGAPANDATFTVMFDNTVTALPTGVLGRAHSYFSGCGSPTKWHVTDMDIIFRRDGSGVTWYFGSNPNTQPGTASDFESVVLHELGHNHQLGHVISPGAVMHYNILTGSNNRALDVQKDIAGGNYVIRHSKTFNACGQTGMLPYSCSTAPVANFNANKTSACTAPFTVNFTDISTNTPSSWNWSFPGGNPASSTAQNPSVTYHTAGKYSVTLTVSNTNGSDGETKTDYIVIEKPPTPTITKNGNMLMSSAISGNQWFYNSTLISGATAQSHTPVKNGNYTVVVKGSNNCYSDTSAKFNFTLTGIPFNRSKAVKIFPNPSSGIFVIEADHINQDILSVKILNILGEVVQTEENKISNRYDTRQINLKGLPDGVYIIQIQKENEIFTSKIIKN